tara:strand:+ start:3340 stop:4725 length:1386 start_codon:yes stop_codon:yes gene_type:complete
MSWNIINIKLFAFILILSSSISRAQNCEKRVEEIFNDIIEGIGNNSIYPPTIEFSNDSLSVASMGDYTVTVERKVIDLFCGEEKFDDKIAYILGHELAHHYLNHTWMANTGLGYSNSLGNFIEDKMYSRDQRKLAESEADLFAGFYGMVSGYNALANAKETLKAIYLAYNLPNEISGYPSFDERINIIDSKLSIANDLALLFEIGNVALLSRKYELSKYCYEFILRQFNSREIYNNLGLSFLLYGVTLSNKPLNNLLLPVSLDQKTRLEVNITRSSFNENPIDMFTYALKQFKKSQSLDSKYEPAKQNELVANFLLLEDYQSRKDFIENQNISNRKLINDLKVINMLIEEKNLKKVKKLVPKGSNISRLNISPSETKSIKTENILKKLGLSLMDLLMSSGEKIGGSKLSLFEIGKFQVFEYGDLYIIKSPDTQMNNSIISEEETNEFIKTNNAAYLIYQSQ